MSGKSWFGKPDTKKEETPSIFNNTSEIGPEPDSIFSKKADPVGEQAKTGAEVLLEEKNHGKYQVFFDNLTNKYNQLVTEMEQEYEALAEDSTSKNTEQNIIQEKFHQQKQRQDFQTIFDRKSSALADFGKAENERAKAIGTVPIELSQHIIMLMRELSTEALRIKSTK